MGRQESIRRCSGLGEARNLTAEVVDMGCQESIRRCSGLGDARNLSADVVGHAGGGDYGDFAEAGYLTVASPGALED